MGGCFSEESRIEPRELEDLNGDGQGGKIVKERDFTDKASFGTLAIYLLVVAALIIYTATQGDINRLLNGYDDCGNVCGKVNKFVDKIECSGKDMSSYKYLYVQNITSEYDWHIEKKCVEQCPPRFQPIFNRCVRVNSTNTDEATEIKGLLQHIAHDLYSSWVEILLMCILALVYSIIMAVLFRYATKFIVWFMLIAGTLALVGITIFLWFSWNAKKVEYFSGNGKDAPVLLYSAIIATIVTVVIVLVIFWMRKKIQLVIQLIREAGKAIAAMPMILFEPVLTFVSIVIGAFIWIYFLLLAADAGKLQKTTSSHAADGSYDYTDNGVITVTVALAIVTAIWMFYFIVDCQHMIIAGSVSRWFFTRNKNNLGSPILRSFYVTCRHHLGTIALGSLIVTIFQIVKMIIKSLIQSATRGSNSSMAVCIKCCVDYCLEGLADLLKYFTRNAYIITAIYGYSFCRAGKRAFHVITNNIYSIVAINSIGDFVLNLAKFFILFFTSVVAFEVLRAKKDVEMFFVPLLIVIIFAGCIGHMFMTVYEMAIDTIFVCFCEDFEENDGLSKPYYMSKELMQFVENSHKLLGKGDRNEQINV